MKANPVITVNYSILSETHNRSLMRTIRTNKKFLKFVTFFYTPKDPRLKSINISNKLF